MMTQSAIRIYGLAIVLAASTTVFAQGTNQGSQDILPPEVNDASATTASESAGLEVNEVRVKGRRDAVQIRRQSGATDYYDDKLGTLNDEGGELGDRPVLRTWRFGGQQN